AFSRRRDAIEHEVRRLRETRINPAVLGQHLQEVLPGQRMQRDYTLFELLTRPELGYEQIMALKNAEGALIAGPGLQDTLDAEQVEIQVKYAGYVTRQQAEIERQQAQSAQPIPDDFDYDAVSGLSTEARQRLKLSQPANIGQASRVSGITPAAVSLLLVHLKRWQHRRRAA
ncbi:MAG TPA: tRNA uridine-5-carboxymethylaminomethyl(34) synthesis enzyme MnmG, partial [Castellaniella sp.]|nr:tRNA uridine-5-carboxymethylaminomethyl(34) synthesis enzyme MnmG [Castellaniella sp.]